MDGFFYLFKFLLDRDTIHNIWHLMTFVTFTAFPTYIPDSGEEKLLKKLDGFIFDKLFNLYWCVFYFICTFNIVPPSPPPDTLLLLFYSARY